MITGSDTPLLEVQSLVTRFRTREGVMTVVDGVSFSLGAGRILGLVGESGSGKTVTGLSLMGLVEPPGHVEGGEVRFRGEDLLRLRPAARRALQGDRIAMIFQDPMATLNPVLRVDVQMTEAVHAHRRVRSEEALAQARRALEQVGISSPDERLRSYPHQLSGGMRQRVAIAIALLHEPDLLIADEPTTALDVTIQAQILSQVQRLVRERGTSLIWISHDLSVVAGLADEIAVMYAGRIVEHGPVDEVLDRPQHPYTQGLIGSLPSANRRGQRLRQIPGMAPNLLDKPPGCAFAPRCPRASAACVAEPPEQAASTGHPGHRARCFHAGPADVAAPASAARQERTA